MTKKDLMDRFCKIWCEAKDSNDKEDINISFLMFKKAVDLLADTNIRSAKELVDCYDGNLRYYNFLTESEAMDIVDRFVNQDGSKGPKWRNPEELFDKVEELGGVTESIPSYNRWALYVTMNKFYSDQDSVIAKWTNGDRDKYAEACYELALTQLKDRDRLCWIRSYYGLGELS